MTSATRSTFRPALEFDLPAVSTLLSRSFKTGPGAPFVSPALMQWKYWDARDDYSEPRAYVLEKNGALLAFAGICPMVFGSGPDAIRGIHMIDWAAAEDSPGSGLTLVNRLAAQFDFILAIGGSESTLKVLPAFGFRECAQAWFAAKPLRPLQQAITHQRRNWKLAPRLLRNSLWAGRRAASVENFRTRTIAPAELTPRWLERPPHEAEFSPRTPKFFAYMLRCPAAPFSLHSIERDHHPEGCFLLSIVRRQARIAGIWLNEPQPLAFRAAYTLAQQAARSMPAAAEITVTGTGDASATAAAEAGFRILGRKPVLVLDRTKRFEFSPNFQFQFSDDDEAWLDTGASDYWT